MKVRYQLRRRCPTCGSSQVSRSRRDGWFEWAVLPFLVLRPYRCRSCMRRYWGFWGSCQREEVEKLKAA